MQQFSSLLSIYYSLAALHVSSNIFAHHQGHLDCITVSGITHCKLSYTVHLVGHFRILCHDTRKHEYQVSKNAVTLQYKIFCSINVICVTSKCHRFDPHVFLCNDLSLTVGITLMTGNMVVKKALLTRPRPCGKGELRE